MGEMYDFDIKIKEKPEMDDYGKNIMNPEFQNFLLSVYGDRGQGILDTLLQGNNPENFSMLTGLLNEFTNFKISNEMKEKGALPPQDDMLPEEELIFLNRLKNMAEGGEMTADAVGIADGLDAEEEMMTAVSEPSDAGIAKVSPDQYVQLMNEVRGDDIPLEGRVQELAMKVGEKDAQDTPLSVLALVQPVFELEEQGGIAQTQEAQSMSQPMMPTAADQLANPQNMGIVRANTGLFINSADAVPFAGQDMSMSLKMPTGNTAASSPQNYDILQGMMSPNQYDFITKMGEGMFDMGKAPVDITQRAKQYEETLLNNADLKSQFLTSVVSPLLLQTAQDILDPDKSFSEILIGGLSRIGTAGQAGTKLKEPYKKQALDLATKEKEIQDTKQSDFIKLFGAEAIKKAFTQAKLPAVSFQQVNGIPVALYAEGPMAGQPISNQDLYYNTLANKKIEQVNDRNKLLVANSVKNLFPDLTNEELIQLNQDADYFVKNNYRFDNEFYNTKEGKKLKFDQESNLRQQWLSNTKDTANVVRQAAILDFVAEDGTGASDMALVFTVMKILDPTSVVRSDEYGVAATTDTSKIDAGTSLLINQVLNGSTVLLPEQRAALIALAKDATAGALQGYSSFKNQFTDITNNYGLTPSNVIIDYTQGIRNLPTQDQFTSTYDYLMNLEDKLIYTPQGGGKSSGSGIPDKSAEEVLVD
jgi:hypothetical protein